MSYLKGIVSKEGRISEELFANICKVNDFDYEKTEAELLDRGYRFDPSATTSTFENMVDYEEGKQVLAARKKSKKPYAYDWEVISEGVEYSKYLDLYWANNTVYDELSARHNGIIGMGATFKKVLKDRP